MKFYATFPLRLSIYYWTSKMKRGKVTHFRNHGERLWLFQFQNPERIILTLLIIDLLLSQVSYVTLERMVNERLVWYLEYNGLLAKQQCGYRSNRSTVDHLVRLETFIRDAFIHNQRLVAVFFDLQKAYDTTCKYGILNDLHSMG